MFTVSESARHVLCTLNEEISDSSKISDRIPKGEICLGCPCHRALLIKKGNSWDPRSDSFLNFVGGLGTLTLRPNLRYCARFQDL